MSRFAVPGVRIPPSPVTFPLPLGHTRRRKVEGIGRVRDCLPGGCWNGRGARVAESGALLRRCTSKGYRGFESPPLRHVPIAQLDRALDCGSKGRRFESSWARRIQAGGSGRLWYIRVLRRPRAVLGLGEMRERSNRAVSKTVEPLAAPWVRIPLSPRVLS